MRRIALGLLAISFASASTAQPWPDDRSGGPSVTDPSVPLTYVGGDGSVSLGINAEGETEGQLLGVFARNDARAFVGQLWWDRAGAGGIQADFNWLWGMDPAQARLEPGQATVARLTFALDQNAAHDRKATLGFGIERREFSLEGYLARGVSGGRPAGSALLTDDTVIAGSDGIGDYTQLETTATELLFENRPYGMEVGLQASHVFEPLAMRLRGGASTQDGDGVRANTFSLGLDTPLGRRGWGLTAQAEQVRRQGSVDGDDDDLRLSAFLRYEFGRNGAFAPSANLPNPAWISRAIARPSSSHPRTVQSYRRVRDRVVSVSQGPREYTNHFPVALADSVATPAGERILIDVLANDSDLDGDALSIAAVGSPAHGSAAIAGGLLEYTPEAGYTGTDRFSYTVVDGRGGTATAMVTVAIAVAANRPPTAVDDRATTAPGTAVSIAVLANDSDPDGDTLALLSVTPAANGSTTVVGASVRYVPQPGFTGVDRFDYAIGDGRGGSAVATVTVTVDPLPNTPPVALDDAATTVEGLAVAIPVLANDADADGDALAIVSVGTPGNGNASFAGGVVTYAPTPGFAGLDTFAYTISDGRGGSASATVTVTVTAAPNTPPVALDDAAAAAPGIPTPIDVLANDSDPDGDPLSITAVTQPPGGVVTINGNVLGYIANTGFSGLDRFTYTIGDGQGGSATATVSVTVGTAPNTPPVALDDAAVAAPGVATPIDVLANDSDADGDPLTITAVTPPIGGTVTITGSVLSYVANAAFAGVDRFSYTISDGRGGSATASVAVTVPGAPNQPPVAVDDVGATTVGTAVVLDVLDNDSDPDGDALVIVSTTQPAGGLVAFDGTSVTYAPAAGFVGVDSFTYTIEDGRGGSATATVTVSVNAAPNQPPVPAPDAALTAVNTPVTIDVLANDTDPDGDPLTIIAVTQPANGTVEILGGQLRYTPDNGFFGAFDLFTYTVSDGRGGTATTDVGVFVNG